MSGPRDPISNAIGGQAAGNQAQTNQIIQLIASIAKSIAAGVLTAGNPSETAGPTAVNGTALTFMRSDAAPAVQKASSSQFGIVEVDNVTIKSTAGVVATINGATGQSQPGNPTAPASTSAYKMQGLAGAITPVRSGTVLLIVSGYITASTTTAGDGILFQLSYGTGTAPVNTGTLAGTQVGQIMEYTNPATVTAADIHVPFSVQAVVTGLTLATAIWIDLAAKSVATTSAVGLAGISVSAAEI